MAAEEESIEQAASARRERLRALRAAQELSATPDDAPDPNGNGEAAAVEDGPIDQAAASRQERLKALREAKELLSTPNGDSTQNGSKAAESEENEDTRDGEELTIRDPIGPVPTKGRPRGASRLKSGFEDSLSQKEVKHRKCGNCQQLGHYRTGCPLLRK